MCGRATLTTVASKLAIALAPTVAANASRPKPECKASSRGELAAGVLTALGGSRKALHHARHHVCT